MDHHQVILLTKREGHNGRISAQGLESIDDIIIARSVQKKTEGNI